MDWRKEGLADLHRQGFMKPRKPRRVPVERPMIACHDCLNWHREGKHTADAATRRLNRAARKAQTPNASKPTKSEISRLVKAYALWNYSVDRAPLRSQQRLHDNFRKLQLTLAARYPGWDFESDAAMRLLAEKASEYWKTRAMKGPGVDW